MRPGGQGAPGRGEQGQILPLICLLLLATAGSVLVLSQMGQVAAERAKARTAADAVALAGALDGKPAAISVARANGAHLDVYGEEGDLVRVVVSFGRASASAAAAREDELLDGLEGVCRRRPELRSCNRDQRE